MNEKKETAEWFIDAAFKKTFRRTSWRPLDLESARTISEMIKRHDKYKNPHHQTLDCGGSD